MRFFSDDLSLWGEGQLVAVQKGPNLPMLVYEFQAEDEKGAIGEKSTVVVYPTIKSDDFVASLDEPVFVTARVREQG